MSTDYPVVLQELIARLTRLPGIGQRTAERLAMALLEWEQPELADLGQRLATLRHHIHPCRLCGNLAEAAECRVCGDARRDRGVICVVEYARQIPVIENCGRYRGLYHVLGGRLAPLDGVEAGDLTVAALLARLEPGAVREIIIATSPDVEGEATAAYLAEELRGRFAGQVSRIALGLPLGADLAYADAATLAMALESRRRL